MRVLKVINIALVIVMTVATLPSTALSSGLLVLYPEVRKPYEKIYQDIISGIKEASEGSVSTLAIAPKQALTSYRSTLDNIDPDNVIALGSNSVALMREFNLELKQQLPVVAGALAYSKTDLAGISMIPDAQVIIDKLILLFGDVRSIHLVTNINSRSEQVKQASEYAQTKHINFIIHPASTVQEAANQYRKLLVDVQENDAIWLRRDKAINHAGLLSEVLETAWKKKVVVFSSSPTHVKHGALFSIYPNNKKLGTSLANLAMENKKDPDKPKILSPLIDVYTVVNDRTRRHLGISLNGTQRAEIDGVF